MADINEIIAELDRLRLAAVAQEWPSADLKWSIAAFRSYPLLRDEILKLQRERQGLLAVARAAEDLKNRLGAVHADERYQSVWILYKIHGGEYTEPTYTVELDKLREALKD